MRGGPKSMRYCCAFFSICLLLLTACQSVPVSRWELMRSGEEAIEAGEYEQAVGYYTQLIQNEPQTAEGYNGRGVVRMRQSRYEEALEDLEQARKLDAENEVYCYNIGLCLYCMGKYEDAIGSFSQALALKPDYTDSLCQRGAAYAHLEKYDQAEADIRRAGELKPGISAKFWAALGAAYKEDQTLDRALSAYTEAVLAEKERPEWYLQRADVYMLQGDYEQARQDLVQAIGMQEGFLAGYELLGDLYYAQEEYEQAIRYYTVALLEQPDSMGYLNRGACYRMLGEYEAAEADYTSAILMDPFNAAAYDGRGQVREALQETEGAKKDYKRAKELLEKGEE